MMCKQIHPLYGGVMLQLVNVYREVLGQLWKMNSMLGIAEIFFK